MELDVLIRNIAMDEDGSLKKLYDIYGTPFYALCASVLGSEEGAAEAAAEAFIYIKDTAAAFDENMNAEYWLFEIAYKVCSGGKSASARRARRAASRGSGSDKTDESRRGSTGITGSTENTGASGICRAEPEVVLSICTGLKDSEIAVITGKKRSAVSAAVKSRRDSVKSILNALDAARPDYMELINLKMRAAAEKTDRKAYKTKPADKHRVYKRIVAAALLLSFLAAAVLVMFKLTKDRYRSDVNKDALGEDILLQHNTHMAMTEMKGMLYYCGADGAFYMRNMNTNETSRISADEPAELLNDGEYVYYRNKKDGHMYRVDEKGGGRTALCDMPGTSMELYGDGLYFSSTGGIYRIPSSGGELDSAELMLDTSNDINLYCVDIAIDDDGNIFFASGVGKGLHHITDYKGEPSLDGVFPDEVYAIRIDSGKLYFDYKDATGKIMLYGLDLKEYYNFLQNQASGAERVHPRPVQTSQGDNIILSTGAFYAENGSVYYAGVSDGISALYELDASGNTRKLTNIAGNTKSLYITDIYASERFIYCYCSDGKQDSKSMLFAYDISGKEVIVI